MKSVGQVIFAFFEYYLKTQKGLWPGSIRSYRDTLKLFFVYLACNCRRPITRPILSDLSAQRVLDFLQMIEVTRGNHVSSRNQRLAALHTFYRYVGLQYPEMLAEAQRVEAIPMKRTAPPQTDYLEHDEIETLFKSLPRQGIVSLRDRAIYDPL
jgi:integrase/recombinase XerD